jgi:hypothetical protein
MARAACPACPASRTSAIRCYYRQPDGVAWTCSAGLIHSVPYARMPYGVKLFWETLDRPETPASEQVHEDDSPARRE